MGKTGKFSAETLVDGLHAAEDKDLIHGLLIRWDMLELLALGEPICQAGHIKPWICRSEVLPVVYVEGMGPVAVLMGAFPGPMLGSLAVFERLLSCRLLVKTSIHCSIIFTWRLRKR